ncbi:ParB-like protein [Cupriavidus sp. 30B13]|uniref:ParB-like protein n=1 Tax=Cupriavidus sp. 30B13 TaxID=3384241 RepID=UPI003B915261
MKKASITRASPEADAPAARKRAAAGGPEAALGHPAVPPGEMRVELYALRPTQLTLGMDQVREKMRATLRHAGTADAARADAALWAFLRRHPLKLVRGPQQGLHIVDHHHWARAWAELGYVHAPARLLLDLGHLAPDAFWRRMETLGHVHPYDEHGKRLTIAALPHNVMGMRNDPYRSLAAFARNAGAYRKPGSAYGDFQWAGLFREHIGGRLDTVGGFALALAQAIKLAQGSKARRLPGFTGKLERVA